jgi:hypothetical protein
MLNPQKSETNGHQENGDAQPASQPDHSHRHPPARVFLAIPHSGLVHPGCAGATAGACVDKRHWFQSYMHPGGCLTHNFNELWCMARNLRKENGFTHFAMCHSDLHPQNGWGDILLDIMHRTGADVVGTTCAIKDDRGITNMGIGRLPENPPRGPLEGWEVRRLTLYEVWNTLPEVFSIEDIKGKHPARDYIAMNTGLWVCKFTDQWVNKFGGFRIFNHIVTEGQGTDQETARAIFRSEDWDFGLWCHREGLKVVVTRTVQMDHIGWHQFGNQANDARWKVDEESIEYKHYGVREPLRGV